MSLVILVDSGTRALPTDDHNVQILSKLLASHLECDCPVDLLFRPITSSENSALVAVERFYAFHRSRGKWFSLPQKETSKIAGCKGHLAASTHLLSYRVYFF